MNRLALLYINVISSCVTFCIVQPFYSRLQLHVQTTATNQGKGWSGNSLLKTSVYDSSLNKDAQNSSVYPSVYLLYYIKHCIWVLSNFCIEILEFNRTDLTQLATCTATLCLLCLIAV